jgi:hypothetical protein
MPTILHADGFEVMIYLRDHRPPHVHVFDADGQAIVNLGGPGEPPSFREVRRMKTQNVVRAMALVREHAAGFLAEWRRIHG